MPRPQVVIPFSEEELAQIDSKIEELGQNGDQKLNRQSIIRQSVALFLAPEPEKPDAPPPFVLTEQHWNDLISSLKQIARAFKTNAPAASTMPVPAQEPKTPTVLPPVPQTPPPYKPPPPNPQFIALEKRMKELWWKHEIWIERGLDIHLPPMPRKDEMYFESIFECKANDFELEEWQTEMDVAVKVYNEGLNCLDTKSKKELHNLWWVSEGIDDPDEAFSTENLKKFLKTWLRRRNDQPNWTSEMKNKIAELIRP